LGLGFAAPPLFQLIGQHEWFQAQLGNKLAQAAPFFRTPSLILNEKSA
jgi:hypothetical protein